MRMVDWDYIRILLEDKLNIPSHVLDIISVKDILQLCASGSSNENIVRFNNVELDYVKSTIQDWFFFDGWEKDCDLNPYQLLSSLEDYDYAFEYFEKEIAILYPYYTKAAVEKMYSVATIYKKLEDEMEKFWI